jgi:hypothetical protein
LIDFFLEVGIPKSTCADLIDNIMEHMGGRFDYDAFEFV